MEHIRQFDWCAFEPDSYFVNERDLDNSVTERILRNKFRNPLISSDSEEDNDQPKFNWDEIFKRRATNQRQFRIYIPGIQAIPQYPKLSSLTSQQHYQLLKVLCSRSPRVLNSEFLPRPGRLDLKLFEDLKGTYEKEQQEYIEWAKTVWSNTQCVRALRPKPDIETLYEAEFKIRANTMGSFPKQFQMAAQIPLQSEKYKCEIIFEKDLQIVHLSDLPQIQCPDLLHKTTILHPCSVSEPCDVHPCRFVLPNEKSISELPLTEVNRSLAQHAAGLGAQLVACERALRCLVEADERWTLPVSVCSAIGLDGESTNVIVLGSEFSIHRESAQTRTYKAFRHLLDMTFVPVTERERVRQHKEQPKSIFDDSMESLNFDAMVNSDDEEDKLVIDAGDASDDSDAPLVIYTEKNDTVPKKQPKQDENRSTPESKKKLKLDKTDDKQPDESEMEVDSPETEGTEVKSPAKNEKKKQLHCCTCKESAFDSPPPRSFKKWQVRNIATQDQYSIVVHCSHKVRDNGTEVVLEPIPEYQIDLGGCAQSQSKIKSLALALYLRGNASLMNVRIDHASGDVVLMETHSMEDYLKKHENVIAEVSNIVYTVVDQLQGLLPGNYILKHEPSHGANAFLFAPQIKGSGEELTLNFDCSKMAEADEAKSVKTPILTPVLLPYHKFRKILPCAFTPYQNQVAKEPKKPVVKQKPPPQAIKWPRQSKKKSKVKTNN